MPRPVPDTRTIREVEATRDMENHKPFRDKRLKQEARRLARKDIDGAWRSSAPYLVRQDHKIHEKRRRVDWQGDDRVQQEAAE